MNFIIRSSKFKWSEQNKWILRTLTAGSTSIFTEKVTTLKYESWCQTLTSTAKHKDICISRNKTSSFYVLYCNEILSPPKKSPKHFIFPSADTHLKISDSTYIIAKLFTTNLKVCKNEIQIILTWFKVARKTACTKSQSWAERQRGDTEGTREQWP